MCHPRGSLVTMAALEMQPFFFLLPFFVLLGYHLSTEGCVSMCLEWASFSSSFFPSLLYIVFSIWRPENEEACQLGGGLWNPEVWGWQKTGSGRVCDWGMNSAPRLPSLLTTTTGRSSYTTSRGHTIQIRFIIWSCFFVVFFLLPTRKGGEEEEIGWLGRLMALVGVDWFSEVICKWNTLERAGQMTQRQHSQERVENMGIIGIVKTLCIFLLSGVIIAFFKGFPTELFKLAHLKSIFLPSKITRTVLQLSLSSEVPC